MMTRLIGCSFVIALALLTAGCGEAGPPKRIDFAMGEKASVGPLVYTVVESRWATQLGEGLAIRSPQQRFLLINLSVTNSGGKQVSLPFLKLEDANGHTYNEVQDGQGVENWFGLLRDIAPAQTHQGRLLFDVPLTSFKLLVPDGGEPGTEHYAGIQIPLRLDADPVPTPLIGVQ